MRSLAFLGDLKGAAAPFSAIRSAGMYGARSIFAELCLPSESKNAFRRICRPGFARYRTGQPPRRLSGTGRSAKGVDLPGLGPGSICQVSDLT